METNIKRWRNYMRDIPSPESYITWGFYSLVACALQRRVWIGDLDHYPLFFNLYVILTGKSGIGKDLVTSVVKRVIESHKLNKATNDPIRPPKNGIENEPMLIQIGANATSYSALVAQLATSIRSFSIKVDENTKKPYIHSSLCLILGELASIFRKNEDDTISLLQEAFDCRDFVYETRDRGKEKIYACCFNILAGTTPEFLKRLHRDEMMNEGFASRAQFIVESAPRFLTTLQPKFDADQLADFKMVSDHIRRIATDVYGQATLTDEAADYLETWWQDENNWRTNKSPQLDRYYGRKPMLIKKLAGIIHFSEFTDMTIGVQEIKWAIDECAKIEINMHGAVQKEAKNPLAEVTQAIFNFIVKEGAKSKTALLMQFYEDLPEQEESLKKVTDYLTGIGKLKFENNRWTV